MSFATSATDFLVDNVYGCVLTLLLFVLAFVYQQYQTAKKYSWPPGPPGLPLFGNLLLIRSGGTTNEEFTNLCNKYNSDIVTLKLFGRKKIVILNSYKALKDCYIRQSEVFAGRPKRWPFTYVNRRNAGIFFANYNDAWKREKKYMLKTVRHFGYGLPAAENQILKEADRLVEYVARTEGQPMDVTYPICLTMMNVTFSLIFNITYEVDNKDVKEVCRIIIDWFWDVFSLFEVEPLLPILDIIPNKRMRDARMKTKKFADFVQRHIDEHRETLDVKNPRDMTDQCLIDMMSTDPNSPLRDFDEEQLLWLILMFIPDQGDTAPAIFRFLLLALALRPEIQEKVHAEIDSVIGKDDPCLDDRSRMPYCDAVILESLRVDAAFFLITPHTNAVDASVMGYHFPKDTEFIPNIWAIHHDPKVWGDPENFRPERFIDEEGTCVRKDELLPFSAGRRTCLGEQLAQKEYFIFFVRLLQKFSISWPEGVPKPELKPQWLYLYPPDHKLVMHFRS